MSPRPPLALLILTAAVLPYATRARANVTVAAYYRLGDDDPGAAPGNLGDTLTLDATANHHDLTRRGTPVYSADVPFNVPTAAGDHLSMFFSNIPNAVGPGPVADDGYSHLAQVTLPSFNWGVEAWVKSAEPDVTNGAGGDGYALIAYNGRYYSSPVYGTANGIGLFQKGSNYVVRIGFHEKILAPVVPGKWTHLVFLRGATANSFYVDGTEELDPSADAQFAPIAANGYLAIGSFPTGLLTPDGATALAVSTNGFYGNIDDVRFFTYTTTGPTAFDASADLLYVAPEPATTALTAAAFLPLAMRRRRRG